MESQRLSMLPKSGNEKGLCSSGSGAAILGEAASSHEPMEIQNLSVREVTDLMAQGEPLSFVIVSEGEGGLEWIENTTVVLESQNVIRPQETERVIVVETTGNSISSQPAECARKSGPKEFVVSRDGMETRKREPPDVPSGLPNAKVIKLSPRDEIISKVDSEAKTKHSNSSNVTLVSSFTEKPDKTAYHSKDAPAKTFSRESPTVMVVKEDSSFLRVYGSSDSSSSSTEGSISNVSFKKELLSDDDTASHQQQITVVTTSPTVLKVSDPGQTRQVVTAVDSFRGKQSLRIHSAGANVESTVNKDIVKKEDTKPTEPQKIIQVTGDSISTGVVEGAVVYRCGECDYASTNKHYYKQHVDLVHNTARPFKCPFCDYAGKRGHALREHLIVHSAQRPYSCLHCNATFRKKGHLTNHTKLHATSSGTLCATGLPGGLLGGAGTIKISTVGNHHMGNFVKVPVEGNGPVITVKAEPSGRETTILAPSHKVHPASAAGISKKKDLWCALCDKEMADAGFFQTHLKTVHGTDRLFACDRCEYVTASKGAILSHLAMHIPTSATTDTPPTTTTATPPSTPLTPVPLYACTHCGFSSPDMNVFIAHAASHNVGAGVGVSASTSAASKAVPKPAQPQQSQISKAICSVCGHVADSTESMHAHLWTHIDTNAANEQKSKLPSQPSQEQKTVMESVPPPVMEQTSAPCAVGLKTLPENAAFKCTECSYVSRDASQFVKHMLVHKTQQNQTPRIQVQSSSSNSAPVTVPVSGASAGKGSYSYKVKPITTENTCQNSESSPFVHDPSRGRFRCTICGYSCEYQRTIKAHIWKHSGHQEVDYPIFQNGPLSMYEDTVPSSQPVVVQGKGSSSSSSSTAVQPHITAAPVHTNTLSHPPSSVTETTSIASPVSALSANTSAVSSAVTSSGSVPVGVKIFTVSGSQVLQSSAPLAMGGVKLIPVPSPVTKPSLPAAEGSKHVIVHVQGAPPPPESAAVSGGKKGEVKNSEPRHRVPALSKGAIENEGDSVKGGEDKESKTQSEAPVTTEASVKLVTEMESHSARSVVTVESVAEADSGGPAVGEAEDTEGRTDASVMKPVNSIVSAKHTLPVCATVNKQHVRVAHPVHAQADKAQSMAPLAFTATSAVGPASTADNSLSESDNLGVKSMEESPPPIDSTGSISNQTLSGNTDSVSRQKTTAVKDDLTTEDPELSIAAQIQNRRSSTTDQSVVVEAVNTVLTPGSFTGLLSQQTSPRVSRSSNSSPVPTPVNPQSVTLGVEQASSRVLRSSKKRGVSEDISPDSMSPKKSLTELALTGKADHSPLSKKSMETQALQDSESAVTLLSLQSRGPNTPLHCPTVGRQTSQEHNSPPESPNRSSSSSSETESLARETPTEGASEDLTHEGELTSGGKNRGGSSGGGICSTLLAVIEQLRERSRSESDAEEKQVAPAAKKRASRRRGRRESEEEVLEIRDSDNIEQLTGEDGVNYRCKLCHYTNARIPLIRLHMRTHRQKDPFECSLCTMVAESSEALQEHMIQHCKVRTYACKVCPQSFNHKSTLRAHMRAHDDPGPNYCYLCEFETSNPLEFRSHMQKHTGSTLLCCPHCSAVVASPQDLRLHQAGNCPSSSSSPVPTTDRDRNSQDPSEDAEKVVCPKCEFTSTDKARMDDHIAGHTATLGMEVAGEGLLRCALCDFTAVSSRSLKSHMKRHANDQRYVQQPLEQYKCLLCGYVCHHLPSLKSHMWRHASDQNYSYQFTNDVINAAIDYDTRQDPSPQPSRTAGSLSKEGDEPELLEKVLSAERRILEGQMNRPAGLQPVCWVTFRCCQCGFQTINKPKLNLHMRTHADIIQQTLQVSSPSIPPKEGAPNTASAASSDSVSVKVVYGPV